MKQINAVITALLICNSLHAQPPSYVPTDGLAGWYGFNGNANDASGNGNHGSVTGCLSVEDRFGTPSSAYSFSGAEYITIENSLLPSSTTSFTISAWFNTHTDDGMIISDRGTNINWFKYMVGVAGSVVKAGNYSSGCNSGSQAISSPFPADQWNHVVVIKNYENGIHQLYLNGTLVAQEALLCYHASNNGTSIGRWVGITTDGYYEGLIDDIGVWNRALSLQELSDLFNGGNGGPCQSNVPVSFVGLDASYSIANASVELEGIPTNGIFIGPGVSGTTFSPATAGEGTHSIVYTYVDENHCVNSAGLCTTVSLGMGLEPVSGSDNVRIFPNPSKGQFTMEFDLTGLVFLQVFDVRGRMVTNEVFRSHGIKMTRRLDLSLEAKGTYKIQVQNDGSTMTHSVVIE